LQRLSERPLGLWPSGERPRTRGTEDGGSAGRRRPGSWPGRRLLGVAAAAALLTAFLSGWGVARADESITRWESRPGWGRQTAELVNAYRTSLGLAPLTWDDRLAAAAQWMAEDRARQCRFVRSGNRVELETGGACVLTHVDTLGRGPLERARAFGYPPASAGENGAVGYHSPQEALEGWKRSPGHDANQRDPSWRHIGAGVACAVYQDDQMPGLGRMELCFYYVMFGAAGEGQAPAPPAAGAPVAPAPGSAPAGGSPGAPAGRPAGGGQAPAAGPCAGRETPPLERATTYVVQPGDTLAGLAQRLLGDSGRYCDLAAWNGIAPPYLLRAGQELKVPAVEAPPAPSREGEGSEGASAPPAPSGQVVERDGEGQAPGRDASAAALLSDEGEAEEGQQTGLRDSHPFLRAWGSLTRLARKLWPF